MTLQEFRNWLAKESGVESLLHSATRVVPPNTLGESAELDTETSIALMFPIVKFVLVDIGLPWQTDKRTFADNWREKFRPWIDQQLEQQSMHPYAVEAAGTEFRRLLSELRDSELKASFENLAGLLN